MTLEMITFLDHALNSKEPAICRVVGEVIEDNSICLLVRYWTVINSETYLPDDDRDNDEVVCILKSTILHRKVSLGWQE